MNHFIEVNQDDEGNLYLVVHSGSRNLGKQVAEHYQNMAYERIVNTRESKANLIKMLKSKGKEKEIADMLKTIETPKVSKQLAYVYGQDFDDYLFDMKITQFFAEINRKAIANEIMARMKLTAAERFTTIHNYINVKTMILRKGAISAEMGEKVIIPLNMRDGSIIAIGKGNGDWNCSAPHGAGRLMSRSAAKNAVSIDEFKNSMEGIWTTSVGLGTLDESPMAYKPMEEIVNNIGDTVDIEKIIKPVYNFKAN